MKYPVLKDGEWVQPSRCGFRDACCDCGLVHRMNFRVRDGHIEFQVFRDGRATAAMRRGKK